MRANVIKNSFNGGEVSPYVLARTDHAKYPNACEQLQNFIPLITGGVTRRPGLRYVYAALGPSRLIPFEFSTTQTFCLEFGNKTLRFFTRDGNGVAGVILSGGVPYVVATPYDTSADDLWDLKWAQQADVMYITHPNHPVMKLSRVTDTNWTFNQPVFDAPPLHAYDNDISGGTITLTPGATSGSGVSFTASSGVFLAADLGRFIVSGAGLAVITAVVSATTVTCDIIDPFASVAAIAAGQWLMRGGPQSYLVYGTIVGPNTFFSRKLGAGGIQDVYTFKQNIADGQPNAAGQMPSFRTTDVGRYLVAGGAVGKIITYVTASHVKVRMISPIVDTITSSTGILIASPQSGGAWDIEDQAFDSVHGYPNACCFMQDRLMLAGSLALPTQVWGSVTSGYENFAKGPKDNDGLDFGINTALQDRIQALCEYRGNLGVFTPREEYMVGGGVISVSTTSPQALTPSNVTAVRQSKNGSSRIQPQVIQNLLTYIWRSKLAAAEMSYSIYQANFGSRNLNILHELITATGIKEMVWQQFPFWVNWFTTLTS